MQTLIKDLLYDGNFYIFQSKGKSGGGAVGGASDTKVKVIDMTGRETRVLNSYSEITRNKEKKGEEKESK